jgi:hypothetical protein
MTTAKLFVMEELSAISNTATLAESSSVAPV